MIIPIMGLQCIQIHCCYFLYGNSTILVIKIHRLRSWISFKLSNLKEVTHSRSLELKFEICVSACMYMCYTEKREL